LATAPDADLRPVFDFYWYLGMSDIDVASHVMDHFDKETYSMSVFTVRRRRKEWGLKSTRKQGHTVQSIHERVQAIKKRFPDIGAETLRKALLQNEKIRVSRTVVAEYLRITEPDAVARRRHRKFKRKKFVAVGPFDMWCIDQHEKLKRHGLFWHVGLDPYPGVTHWCRVWWTVKNPTLITKFYLDAARAVEGIPLTTQSDPGTENFGVAYAQTALRHRLDPSLAGSIQHRFFRKHGNIKPEIFWSLFRRGFIAAFEAMIDDGVEKGWYDVGDPLEMLTFRFVFIPYLQRETDDWVHLRNWTKRRADRKKILPNGIPMLVMQKPHQWNAANYKIPVPSDIFNEIEAVYAPPDDPVFKLVPDEFLVRATAAWASMGSPEPQFETVWDIYREILARLRSMPADAGFRKMLNESSELQTQEAADDINTQLPDDLAHIEFVDDLNSSVGDGSDDDEELIADGTDAEGSETSEGHGVGLDFF
ncbi:hypothetical protein DENSPDRAFT_776760, partial [Dentipellis sp. KUC8613]